MCRHYDKLKKQQSRNIYMLSDRELRQSTRGAYYERELSQKKSY